MVETATREQEEPIKDLKAELAAAILDAAEGRTMDLDTAQERRGRKE